MNANDFSREFVEQQRTERERHPTSADSRPLASIRGSNLLHKEEVYKVVGCAIEVLNGIGHGLHEKPYENALVVEFGLAAIPYVQQP